VNPVTNKIYTVGGNGMTIIDGATNTATTVATSISYHPITVNTATNQIYGFTGGANAPSGVAVMDGATKITTVVSVPGLPLDLALNPITRAYFINSVSR
jgi:hypothetical protein